MDVLSATQARAKLYRLIDKTTNAHRPVLITGERNNAVLIVESDWNAIQETLYLISIPGMAESIALGSKVPVKEYITLKQLKLGLTDSIDTGN